METGNAIITQSSPVQGLEFSKGWVDRRVGSVGIHEKRVLITWYNDMTKTYQSTSAVHVHVLILI